SGNEVEDGLGVDGGARVVVHMQVSIDDRAGVEADGDAMRELEAYVPSQHPEQIAGGAEAVPGPEPDAAARVADAAPEVGRVAVLPEVLPGDEVMRAGGHRQLERRDVHAPVIRGAQGLAAFPVAARRTDERRS